jgi:hypothetical protein
LTRLLQISIVLVFFVPVAVTAVSFEDEGTTIVTTPGSIISLDVVDGLSLSSFDAVVCITSGAQIVNARYEHEGVILPPCPVVEGPGCLEFGEFWSGSLPDGAVAQVKIKYEIGGVIVSLSPGYTFGGTWYTDDTPAGFSSGVVTIVPEPATFLLLALGAVLLTKKR